MFSDVVFERIRIYIINSLITIQPTGQVVEHVLSDAA